MAKLTILFIVTASLFASSACNEGAARKSFRVIETSDSDFNSLHKQFRDDIRISKNGDSWGLSGLCNYCSISAGGPGCRCTLRMCFRATPSESFVCGALSAGNNLSILEDYQGSQQLTLKFTQDGKKHWIKLETVEEKPAAEGL